MKTGWIIAIVGFFAVILLYMKNKTTLATQNLAAQTQYQNSTAGQVASYVGLGTSVLGSIQGILGQSSNDYTSGVSSYDGGYDPFGVSSSSDVGVSSGFSDLSIDDTTY